MTLEEIFKLTDPNQQVLELKKRKTPLPDVDQMMKEWDPFKHDIWANKEKYPDGIKIIEEAQYDSNGNVVKAEVTKTDPRNRIPLPIEQDQVNIHTAFTVGKEPRLTCESDDPKELDVLKIVKRINKANKMRFLNKKMVRSLFAEQEVAEYWYVVTDESFWSKIFRRIKAVITGGTYSNQKLKVMLWSPFRGDKLYPKFDALDNLVALSREYRIKNDDGSFTTRFMTITDTDVIMFSGIGENGAYQVDKKASFKHGFSKMPVVYSYRKETLCHNIEPIRDRLEVLTSNYADCIDYNFFPRAVVEGDIVGKPTRANGDMIRIDPGGKVYYLTWNQTPESAKFEFDSLMEKCYAMTNTPRLTIDNLKSIGNIPSGKAFQFLFMGTLLAVDNHAEIVGEHIQRRTNFQIAAIGDLNTLYSDVTKNVEIDAEIVPNTIDNLQENIDAAVKALEGGVASRRTGVTLAGIVDNVEEEIQEIESNTPEPNKPGFKTE